MERDKNQARVKHQKTGGGEDDNWRLRDISEHWALFLPCDCPWFKSLACHMVPKALPD